MWQSGKKVGISGGEKLLDRLSHLHQDWEYREDISIKPVSCMSACSRACAIALAAPGKYTYLFGDLNAESDNLPDTCAAILDCARQYYAKSDGLLAWSERPELMKKGAIARIPPLTELSINS